MSCESCEGGPHIYMKSSLPCLDVSTATTLLQVDKSKDRIQNTIKIQSTVMISSHLQLYLLLLSFLSINICVKSEFRIPSNNSVAFHRELKTILDKTVDHSIVRRDAGCPGGEGNYGFNSFNFMTFMLLVYNLVTNVNNNLNNNNNNANKNNINAINQDSQTVSSSTNAVNQLMVTVLPIPGKRSVEDLVR